MLTALTRTAASRSLARSLHTTPARTMPLYVCYCPDYPDNLQTRLKAREAHLAAATEDKKTGASESRDEAWVCSGMQLTPVFGRAFLDDKRSTHTEKQPHEDQLSGMDGSVMILRQPTIEAAWDRIKADEYWKQGVWDKEKVVVREIIGAPVDETIKIQ
ncbi:hypothetical protein A1Q2_04221 [Trichosporon asahii var. asahii CBS 8904]|uniref:YCII-related domain-containing protein n=2 Tax=Trichosporon asahii var. asahii TaxID=189963 RepID=K1VPS5_TRIAC|nr:hypothetical protein A1Q1_03419 [Trichosporon asahii var. asahii CBS 2479]EJT47642.1 hypothetical protein A1Q1_03419 [Trichosporon asahii var. asahii CBS 2479]EKD01472.1 hypothetical protein A1Q2_04221 [Trichosporon asahii var. asahii CBS 8904]